MEEKLSPNKEDIERYQCSDCVNGCDIDCYEQGEGVGCSRHHTDTQFIGYGKIFLGMPIGFNRLGAFDEMELKIYERLEQYDVNGFDKFNIPVWKHKDKYGNTLVRGISPRINSPFIFVFLEDCMDKINCLEITNEDIEGMD